MNADLEKNKLRFLELAKEMSTETTSPNAWEIGEKLGLSKKLISQLLQELSADGFIQFNDISTGMISVTDLGELKLDGSNLSIEAIPTVGDLPVGSYMPFPPNPLFTGREADLRKLAEVLCPPLLSGYLPDRVEGLGRRAEPVKAVRSAVIMQAITGLGGVGKTQLAVEFAYRYGSRFCGVHWLNLADPDQFDLQVARAGSEMCLPDFPDDQPSQVTLTLNTWKTHGPRLLILDNFEDTAQMNDIMARLRHSNLRLLVTSRRPVWSATTGLNPLALDLFSKEESLAFLSGALQKRNDIEQILLNLSARLGYLPLALELASRYLNGHPRLNAADYLEQAKHVLDHPSMQDWRKDMPTPTGHDLDLRHTFALSWKELFPAKETKGRKRGSNGPDMSIAKNPLDSSATAWQVAQNIFLASGYLASDTAIPLEIFEEALQISSDQCDGALALLYGLGLLRESGSLPTIHPLLAEYSRDLSREFVKILEVLAGTLVALSKSGVDPGLPVRFESIKPHIFVLAQHAENEKIGYAGALWNNYGHHLKMIADYSGARTAYEHALKMNEASFGPDHPNVAADASNLGMVLKDLGDLNGARAALERALKIDETSFGSDHPDVATDVNNLGLVMQSQGDLDGARAAYERALKIDETTFGPNHPNVARDVNNLGLVMKALGDLTGARKAFGRALKIDEASFGSNHPNIARDVNNLGLVMKAQGDLDGAHAAYERALKIDETSFGPDHPMVARDVNNLGSVMKAQGDLDGAREAFERALGIFKKFLPPDHPNTKTVQGNLDTLE